MGVDARGGVDGVGLLLALPFQTVGDVIAVASSLWCHKTNVVIYQLYNKHRSRICMARWGGGGGGEATGVCTRGGGPPGERCLGNLL